MLRDMNNSMYNRYCWLYFTMTSVTSAIIHSDTIGTIFNESAFFSMVYYITMSVNGFVNANRLLFTNIMNKKILRVETVKSVMFYMNDIRQI